MYHKFFNGFDEKNGYGNYIGSIYKNGHSYAMKKCSTEDFYKTLGKILDKIQPEKEDENVLEELKVEVKNKPCYHWREQQLMERFQIRYIFRN